MRYIDGETLNKVLDFPSLADALARWHQVAPPEVGRSLLQQDGEGETPDCFLNLPAWYPGAAMGVKVITVLPANPGKAHGLPAIQALYPVFDGETGAPKAVIDGTALTYWKTAGDSALATRYLAREDASSLLVVGSGALAPYLARAHCAMRPSITKVMVWNRTAEKAEAMASELAEAGLPASAVTDLEAACRQADIVSCATSATSPLIKGAWLRPGCHLDLVGSFTPEMREADDDAIRRAAGVFMDFAEFASEPGDICIPIESGLLAREDIVDFYAICQGEHEGRNDDEQITLFKNVGGAHLDLMTALHILDCVADDK
ncbi:MAG: ornithine cyclodeaminase family protein [Alphaproteobacteria bacterium]|nr:ornithine cyclodeaminase family protein [Alphaproteobacteria bacterium]